MVDVGWNDGATAGDFFAHELRSDFFRDVGAKAVAGVLLFKQTGSTGFLQLHVFADGDVFHLGRNDALTRIVHLADVNPGLGPTRVFHVRKTQFGQLGIVETHLPEVGAQAWQALRVAAVIDPR